MTTTELQQLLANKTWRAELSELTDTTFRLFLQDLDSGECGMLAIEAEQLVLPDESGLVYSWQSISTELGPPPEECLIADLKTKVSPDYDRGEVLFLFD